jgi:GT2 family glycosyltransferase
VGGRVLPVGQDLYSIYYTIYHILEPPPDMRAVIGANCMFWKQPVVDAGLFDEYFVLLGGEETALCMKLWLRGFRFGFAENGIVYHEYRQSLRDFITTFYYYGNGEMVLYLHSLNGYLRYWQFPEKMYNNIAFRKHSSFLLLFTRHMISDIADQYRFLRAVSTSRKERLILNFLYAMHHIFYNLGRGTFSGTLSKTVEHYLADNPGCLLTPDPRG